LILTILTYGSEVCGLNDSTKLEGTHFRQTILGMRSQTKTFY